MSLTRADLRDRVIEEADAQGSTRWDTTAGTGKIDRHIGIVHKKEWKRILNAAPFYRTAVYTPTSDSSGRVLFTALTDTSVPNSGKYFYRVLQVAFNNVALKSVSPKDAYLTSVGSGQPTVGQYGIYYRDDAGIVIPGYPTTQATGIRVNHTPTRADLLSVDTAIVEFPDDYEDILVYEAAARMLAKGASETGAAAELKAMAEEDRRDMLQDIARIDTGPMVLQFPDGAGEWGVAV